MSNWAIIVAAGKGVRFGDGLPKQFHQAAGKPLLAWSIAAFDKAKLIEKIVVVVSADFQLFVTRDIIEKFGFMKVIDVVIGGESRRVSVLNAIKSLPDSTKLVAIHDAVRPLVLPDDIDKVVATAQMHKAAILAVPVKETVKQVEGVEVVKTMPRDKIWLAQTPQAFEYKLIRDAHEKFQDKDAISVTDDSFLAERMGIPVRVIEPSEPNTKVTTLEDLNYIEAVLKMRLHG